MPVSPVNWLTSLLAKVVSSLGAGHIIHNTYQRASTTRARHQQRDKRSLFKLSKACGIKFLDVLLSFFRAAPYGSKRDQNKTSTKSVTLTSSLLRHERNISSETKEASLSRATLAASSSSVFRCHFWDRHPIVWLKIDVVFQLINYGKAELFQNIGNSKTIS